MTEERNKKTVTSQQKSSAAEDFAESVLSVRRVAIVTEVLGLPWERAERQRLLLLKL